MDEHRPLPPGYRLCSDGIIDAYYCILDNDLGEIVTNTHATPDPAIHEAWTDHHIRNNT